MFPCPSGLKKQAGKSLDVPDADIFELHPHRFASVQLESQDPVQQRFFVAILKVQDESVVHVVLDVVPLGDDDHVIPVIQLEQFLEASCVDEGFSYFFAIFAPGCFFTDQTGTATSSGCAPLVVNEPRDTR